MLRKNNCCVEVAKEVWRSSFSKNIVVMKNSLDMPEGKLLFEKKKNPKLN